MAAFSSTNFAYNSYASNRPDYPQSLYELILAYHRGSRENLLDLGCGHGTAIRTLAPHFKHAIGADPSVGMLKEAERIAKGSDLHNIEFLQAAAESISTLAKASVDLVISGQAAHWFSYPPQKPNVWEELTRVVKPGGTVAFWGYADLIFPQSAFASETLHRWTYGEGEKLQGKEGMGPYWNFPGRARVETLYGNLVVPDTEWETLRWIRHDNRSRLPFYGNIQSVCGKMDNPHEANTHPEEQAAIKLQKEMSIRDFKEHARTWSAYHNWRQAHGDKIKRTEGGEGDVLDWMIDEVAEHEDEFRAEDNRILVEWPTGLLLVRRKSS